MMHSERLWHAARDAYHCAFRLLRLSEANSFEQIELERARVLDMYLLFPSLLHRASMPAQIRQKFRALTIPKPEKLFQRLPGAAAVFQELRLYQNSAVTQLAAKGILSPEALKQGVLDVSPVDTPMELIERAANRNHSDGGLSQFLVTDFSEIPLRGPENMYRRSGLPSRAITI